MPKVFEKNATITLIEYGSDQQGLEALGEMKTKIASMIRKMVRR